MKVYCLFHSIPYKGSDLLSIHSTFDSAFTEAERIINDDVYEYLSDGIWEDQWDDRYHIIEKEVTD